MGIIISLSVSIMLAILHVNNVHFSLTYSNFFFFCMTKQVIQAKVLKCDVENEKLLLSFKAVTQNDLEKIRSTKFDLEVGKVEYH